MFHKRNAMALLAVFAISMVLHAQDFKLGSRTVQMHGFASQGFAYSNDNNFLTMNTSSGSPAFTEGALNLSMAVTDKFRVGGQGYARKIGSLDDGRPALDWAYGDYKFAPWFGVRGGKVKTAIGLYNDTQDMAFLYTWALLPQGVYPTDLRSTLIAHTGGDVYGRINLKKAGKLDYTGYYGLRSVDDREGYTYFSAQNGINVDSMHGRTEGWDLRWATAIKGLTLGTSWANLTMHRNLNYVGGPYTGFYYTVDSRPDRAWVGYGNYSVQKWEFSAEYRSYNDLEYIHFLAIPFNMPLNQSTEAWFSSATYRITPKIQVGVYHSNVHYDNPANKTDSAANHIYDEVGTVRYDLNSHWDVKAEGHFMDGYGDIDSEQGFYAQWNPKGLKPKTDMLVLRTSYNF